MNEPDAIDALLEAAASVREGAAVTSETFTAADVPARLRLVVAAAALAGAGQPVNKSSILDTAQVARSATYRNHAGLLDALCTDLPSLVIGMLADKASPGDAHALREQLELAHASIERERRLRRDLEVEREQERAYALELHRRLKPEYDALMHERSVKVRTLRPVPGEGQDIEPKPQGKEPRD